MACPKFLRTDLNPTGQSGGQWTYVGYNSSVPGPPWSDTPSIPLVNVSAGQVYTPGNDNPTINPLGVSAGFYAFDYVVNAPVSGGNACSDTKRIEIEIAPSACAGNTKSITLCGDAAPINLIPTLQTNSACTVQVGTLSGSLLSNPGYTGSPSYTFDPTLSTAGTFTFTNTVNVTPTGGFDVQCADCAQSAATLTITVLAAEANGTASATACVGQDQVLNMFTLSGSAVTNGSWFYLSGPNPTQSVNWNGVTSNASANTLLSVGQAASLQTSTLAEGSHVFRYVTSTAPCLRYKDITVNVSLTPTPGIANPSTVCGGSNCASILLNSLVSFETSGGTFSLTTDYTGAMQVSIDGAAPVTFNQSNPLGPLAYGSLLAVTSFPSDDPVSINYSYTVTSGGCSATSSSTITVVVPSSGMSATSAEVRGCLTTPTFLLRSNITNFRPGGNFTMRYRATPLGAYSSYTGAAFLNQFVGSPPPSNSVHSLTAAFNPAVAASGWYEVRYTTYAAGTPAGFCTDCQGQTLTYVFRLNGNPCGCFPECDVQPGAIPVVPVCNDYTDCVGNTYTNFNVNTATEICHLNLGFTPAPCPVQPDFNWWRLYISQGPANPTINGIPINIPYPFQLANAIGGNVINWSTTTPGTYRISIEPQLIAAVSTTQQQECFTGYYVDYVVCAPSPCEINIDSLTYNSGTISSSVSGCAGTVTYSWTGPSGFTATTANITPNRIGTYTLTATCPDGSTCTSQTSITLTCADLGLTVATSTNDITASLTGPCEAPVVYTWTRPNGGGTTTGATITPNNGNGIYSVTSSCNGVATGCTATYTCGVNVSITNNGSQLIGSAGGCGGNQSNYVYAWTAPSGFTAATASITPSISQTYTLTVTCVDSGCTASASAAFTVTCNLGVSIAASGNNLVATGSGTCTGGTYSYSWNAQPSNVTTIGSTVAYVAGQTYTVTMTCVGGPNTSCPATTATFACPAFTVNIA